MLYWLLPVMRKLAARGNAGGGLDPDNAANYSITGTYDTASPVVPLLTTATASPPPPSPPLI